MQDDVRIGVLRSLWGVLDPVDHPTPHVVLIVFALANPVPEIKPDDAKEAGAYVVATGRSDYPNQVNNSLAFPGIFRGALDRNVQAITDEMKLAAAKKTASLVKSPTAETVIPSVMTEGLVKAVASVIK